MPRNPAPVKKKKTEPEATKPKPTEDTPVEPGEERGVPDVDLTDPIDEEPPAPPVQVIERRIETKTVEIPLGEPPHRIRQIHIEVLLCKDHAHTFGRLRQALGDKDARTADGRAVKSGPDALRWLLEQLVE